MLTNPLDRLANALTKRLPEVGQDRSVIAHKSGVVDITMVLAGKSKMARLVLACSNQLNILYDDMKGIGGLWCGSCPRWIGLNSGRPMQLGIIP